MPGAGAAEGAIDAASILKPMLARGEIQLIGATTPEEYRKSIAKDSALDRRFGKVMVEEPAPAQAESILRGLMPRYERYHSVAISPECIRAAVELSVRYLPGRFLPDKAIDLLDEAAAAARIAAGAGGKNVPLQPSDVARVVSRASGIPAERVGEAERERLEQLEERLSAEVVGQPRAVKAVAAAIRRSRTGLREAGRPIGAMLFLGPTGVGKTQLPAAWRAAGSAAKKPCCGLICRNIWSSTRWRGCSARRPAMSAHDEGGQLTEAVRRRPYSVVLFDEIEKAHSEVQNLLLQILEDGCLTDAQGRKADFSNTIILLTSNLGARCLAGRRPRSVSARPGPTATAAAARPAGGAGLLPPRADGPPGRGRSVRPARPCAAGRHCRPHAVRTGTPRRRAGLYAAPHPGRPPPRWPGAKCRPTARVSCAARSAALSNRRLADRIAAGTARPGAAYTADVAPDGRVTLTEQDLATCG